MRSQKIETMRKRFKKRPEWMLIEVHKSDELSGKSLAGRLLAHHPERDVIYKEMMKFKNWRYPILVDCSSHKLPKGMQFALICPLNAKFPV